MTLNVRDRVFSAAEMISFECPPTIKLVQAAAGVSVSEATQYLAEWEEEQRYDSVQAPALGPARGKPTRHSSPKNFYPEHYSSRVREGLDADNVSCFNPAHQGEVQKLAVLIQRLESAIALLSNQFERTQAERAAAKKHRRPLVRRSHHRPRIYQAAGRSFNKVKPGRNQV